jgi:hypothetical protein
VIDCYKIPHAHRGTRISSSGRTIFIEQYTTNYRENKKANPILTLVEGLFEMKRLRGIQYTNEYCNLKDETSQSQTSELVMLKRKVNAYIF